MNERKVLQEKIDRVRTGETDITFTKSELFHKMYLDGPHWMKIDDLAYYFGNNVTIEGKVKKYLSQYYPDLFRPIEVCIIDGMYHIDNNQIIIDTGTVIIINGHHRKAMLEILNMPWIQVYIRDDIKTEQGLIEYYIRLNKALVEEKKTQQNIHDNASMIRGSIDEYIDSIHEKYGVSFNSFKAENAIRCIDACRKLVEKNGRYNYDRTIYVLTMAFDGDSDSLTAAIIKNISYHLKENEGYLDFQGWLDLYIKQLRTRPAVEWNKRWTPTRSRALALKDLHILEAAVEKEYFKFNPKNRKKKANSN